MLTVSLYLCHNLSDNALHIPSNLVLGRYFITVDAHGPVSWDMQSCFDFFAELPDVLYLIYIIYVIHHGDIGNLFYLTHTYSCE